MQLAAESKRWSLLTRILIVSGIPLLLMGFVSGLALFQLEGVGARTTEIAEVWLPANQNLAELRLRVQTFRTTQWELVSESNKDEQTAIVSKLETLNGEVFIYSKQMSGLIQNPTSQAVFDKFSDIWSRYSAGNTELLKHVTEQKADAARSLMSGELEKSFDEIQAKLKELDEIDFKASMNAKDQSVAAVVFARRTVLFSVPLVFLFAGFLSWFISSRITQKLIGVAENLRIAADEFMSRGMTLAEASRQLSQSTTDSSSAIDETSATTAQIHQALSLSAADAKKTATAISRTQDDATSSRSAIEDANNAMKAISAGNSAVLDHAEQNHTDMAEIEGIMQQIGEKTKVINDIVFQTKLLSFNASVEAARAGEHGKGFAVVAEEIGSLAQMSGTAAREIGNILGASSQKVSAIVHNTKERITNSVSASASTVETGMGHMQSCLEKLNKIVNTAQEASEMASGIAKASDRQAVEVGAITSSMERLAEVTSQNRTLAESTSDESSQLQRQSDVLLNLVRNLEAEVLGQRAFAANKVIAGNFNQDSGFQNASDSRAA